MSSPERAVQAVLDAQPDLMDKQRVAKVARVIRTQTGASLLTVDLDDEELECSWLRSFNQSITAGAVTPGAYVLVHLVDGQCIVADLIMRGASSG